MKPIPTFIAVSTMLMLSSAANAGERAKAATRRPRFDDGGQIVATTYFLGKRADDAFKSEIEGACPLPARIAGTDLRPHISRIGYRYMVHWRVPA